jgi:anti-sigma factor RsiW
MNEEALNEKIETYLRGKLNPEDAQKLEADMAHNSQLAELVEKLRFEKEGREVIIENDLRAKMAQWLKDEIAPIPKPNTSLDSDLDSAPSQ